MKVEVSGNGLEAIYHKRLGKERSEVMVLQAGLISGVGAAKRIRVNLEALWLGNHFLRQDEVAELRDRLTAWLQTGSFRLEGEELPTEGHGKVRNEGDASHG